MTPIVPGKSDHSIYIASKAGFAVLGFVRILPVMAQRICNGTTGFTLLAVPFFILADNLMISLTAATTAYAVSRGGSSFPRTMV